MYSCTKDSAKSPRFWQLVASFALILSFPALAAAQHQRLDTISVGGIQEAGAMFEITAHTAVNLYRFGFLGASGSHTAQIWERPGGMGSTPTAPPEPTGWTLVGSAPVTVTSTTDITQVPLDLNISLAANETRGFIVILTGSGFRYTTGTTQAADTYSDANMSINAHGYGLRYGGGTPVWSQAWSPRVFNGSVWYTTGPDLEVNLEGPTTTEVVESNSTGTTGDGEVLIDVTLSTGTEFWSVTDLEFTVTGTGDGSTAFSELGLYEDDGSGDFDGSSVDLLATVVPGVAFSASNGTYTATLIDPDFPAATQRRFFLVGKLDGSATAGQTFEVALTNVTASTQGSGVINGVPTTFSAGIEIAEARLEVTYWGPFSPQPHPFDATGPHGDGVLMFEVTLEAFNDDFTFSSVDIRSFGTGNSAQHLSEIALYADNGNDTWDGAAVDTLLASAPAFPTDNGTWSPTLGGLALPRNVEQRFYLVAKLNGQAPNGALFGATIDALHVSSPATHIIDGIPFSAALSITVSTPLSVTTFDPLIGSRDGGEPITIQGTGFRTPVSVRIDGVLAPGTPQINGNGTEVTGLTVPAGRGENLTISVTSGTNTIQLTETFTYEEIPVVVEAFAPQSGAEVGGDDIVITGSGFRAPIALSIGGVAADGAGDVNGDGTEITGFLTPAGTGQGLEIVLTVEGVEYVLSQTFSYRRPGSDDDGGCGVVANARGWLLPMAVMLTLLAAVGRRRRGSRRRSGPL